MSSTAIVWFRRDLRLHDHPPLRAALAEHDRVVPVFVLDRRLLEGRFPSPARASFLHGSLKELGAALRKRGAALIVREGEPAAELLRLAKETNAAAAYWAADVSPFATNRDARVREELGAEGVEVHETEGNFAIDLTELQPYKVFSPYHRAWLKAGRRDVQPAPRKIAIPTNVRRGRLPAFAGAKLSDPVVQPGEGAARKALTAWLRGGLKDYANTHDDLAAGSSGLSPYLHFGCISAREVEAKVAQRRGKGPEEFRRQLAWRDFYGQLLLHHPEAARRELQERYRKLEWDSDEELLDAWRDGRTGYPLVDAGMRQLRASGFMHNRARLVVGSFLTKDLHLDWRAGERHFMRHLLDGDEANNNGNWQWIASVGADPAPYFRRLLNPTAQQKRHDPRGDYVRRWVPELAKVPDEHLAEPWKMSDDEQRAAGCVIGRDYPAPVVDHGEERRRAIARYRSVA
ncbi:MAG TPA: deoxyribodipyrimidine photo-lyase [Thermoleophilaceae bacterium]